MGGDKPGVEAAKWLAFALMVFEHVSVYLLPHPMPVAYLLGRLVFPLFAIALAEGMAGGGEFRTIETLKRLVMWSCVAQVPWSFFDHTSGLNVLFQLTSGLALYLAVFSRGGWSWRILLGVGALAVGCASEFGFAGLLVVFAALWWREERTATRQALVVFALACLYVPNGTHFALLALPVWWALEFVGTVPRVRHFFYYGYTGHLAVIAFLRGAL